MWLGAHVSGAQGLTKAVQQSIEMQANTLQFFTRNPRGGRARALDFQDIEEAHRLMAHYDWGPLVAHAPYTYNLASLKKNVRSFSLLKIKDDLQRIKAMGVPYLVLHVGSHGGQGETKGLALVIEGLRDLLSEIPVGTMILLEGMAGQGTELGYTLAHLAEIIGACADYSGLGVCLDSCHLTGAGYDLADYEGFKKEFKQMIGWDYLKVFHLNDSLHPLGSRKDRHAQLGEGFLGWEIIKKIVRDPEMQGIPLILETPNDYAGYAREIALIKEMVR